MRNSLLGTRRITNGQMTDDGRSSHCFRSRWSTSASKTLSCRHYIRVHPSRLTLERTPITIQSKNEGAQETQQCQPKHHNRERQLLLTNRSKINICTNCFTKLEYQWRCENSIFARKKNRKNCIFASILGSQNQ